MRFIAAFFVLIAGVAFAQDAATTTTLSAAPVSAVEEALSLVGNKNLPVEDRIEIITNIITRYPDEAKAWTVLGELRLEAKDDEGALVAFERAAVKDPTLYSPWHWIGILKKRESRDLEGALVAFRNAMKNGAPPARELNEIAVTLAMMDRLGDALDSWEEAIAADPEWGVLYYNLIRGELARGNEEKARQWYIKSIDAERFEERTPALWAEHLVRMEKFDEAKRVYEQALGRDPRNPKLRYYYAQTLARDDKDRSMEELRRAIADANASGDKTTASVAGKAHFALENPKEFGRLVQAEQLVTELPMKPSEQEKAMKKAIDLLNPLVAKYPGMWEPSLLRGIARRRLGLGPLARQDFERVLADVPGQPQALINLALLYRDEKIFNSAVEYARKAVDAAPNDPAVLVNAAFIMMDTRNCSEAKQLLESARDVLPDEYEEDALGPLEREMKTICP